MIKTENQCMPKVIFHCFVIILWSNNKKCGSSKMTYVKLGKPETSKKLHMTYRSLAVGTYEKKYKVRNKYNFLQKTISIVKFNKCYIVECSFVNSWWLTYNIWRHLHRHYQNYLKNYTMLCSSISTMGCFTTALTLAEI